MVTVNEDIYLAKQNKKIPNPSMLQMSLHC